MSQSEKEQALQKLKKTLERFNTMDWYEVNIYTEMFIEHRILSLLQKSKATIECRYDYEKFRYVCHVVD